MKKNMQKTVIEFLSMTTDQRDELFSRDYNKIPSIEARAKLFVNLPVNEAVRLLSEVESSIQIDHFLFDHVFELPNTKTFVFEELIPKISATRSVVLMFKTGPFMFIKDMFNLLPVETAISIIDEGCIETSEHEEKTFEMLYERIGATQEGRLGLILNGIKPESFKAILDRRNLLEKEQKLIIERISLIEDEKKIAVICTVLSTKKALPILIGINNKQKQKNVLKLIPQAYKNAFFQRISDKKVSTLRSSEVDAAKLDLRGKKSFFKKFPRSKQVDKLSIAEKIEIFS